MAEILGPADLIAYGAIVEKYNSEPKSVWNL